MHKSKRFIAVGKERVLLSIYTLIYVFSSMSLSGQSFGLSKLNVQGHALQSPSGMAFGPDGKLYVAETEGQIHVFDIERSGANEYKVVSATQIHLIQAIPNHHEDGSPAPEINNRKLSSIIAAGSPSRPILYVSSYDPRAGISGNGDMNLDTNSGIISKLSWDGKRWKMVHLVRGLPRSKESQGSNSLFLAQNEKILYVAQAGHTHAGAPSEAFGLSTEYALSAGILSLDLELIESLPVKIDTERQAYKYDLPTVNNKNQMGGGDISSSKAPWGGLDGLNQARLVLGGPVQVYAPGFRNPQDILISAEGFMYVTDEAGSSNLGGIPYGAGSPSYKNARLSSSINNDYLKEDLAVNTTARMATSADLGQKNSLHLVKEGYFAGHPNPIRANPKGAGIYVEGSFRNIEKGNLPKAWPPVDMALANPIEGDINRTEESGQGMLFEEEEKLRSLVEYTASNFTSSMKGDILISTWCKTGKIHKISPSATDGSGYPPSTLIAGLGEGIVALESQGDQTKFPGTIWALIQEENKIQILEPSDYGAQFEEQELEEKLDGNSHLRQSGNSGYDIDQDGLANEIDPFPWDALNGDQRTSTVLPFHLSFKEGNAKKRTELEVFQQGLTQGGAYNLSKLPSSPYSLMGKQVQKPSPYQMSIKLCEVQENVWVRTQLKGPYFLGGSANSYLQGMYLGNGDADNFLMLALQGDGKGGAGFTIIEEIEGESSQSFYPVRTILAEKKINLFWELDPFEGTAQAYYSRSQAEELEPVGPTIRLSGKSLQALTCEYNIQGKPSHLAIGLHASHGSAPAFQAKYDFLEVYTDRQSCALQLDKSTIDFLAIPENTTKYMSLDLFNPLMFKMDISHVQLSGADADMFEIKEHSFVDLDAEHNAKLEIAFTPTSSGKKEALLQVFNSCSGKALEIPLTGMGATFSEVLYRVNAGGSEIPATDGGLDWEADEERIAISYAKQGSPKIALGTAAGDLSYHSSVPGITPPELFERARVGGREHMSWSFPVDAKAGEVYQLCLYMVNSGKTVNTSGPFTFDVTIEGKVYAKEINLAKEYGEQTAVTLCFPVIMENDGSLDIEFSSEKGKPFVNALEIRGVARTSEQGIFELEGFHAEVNKSQVFLNWQSEIGKELQGFIVQMMQERDGSAALFQDVGFVSTKGVRAGYVYQVSELVPDNYVFRLKTLDKEGKYAYSEHVKASIVSEEMGLYTYPNPSKGMLNITLTTSSEQNISLNLMDVNGKKIKVLHQGSLKAGTHKLGFNIGEYPNGIYLLEASNGQIRKVSKVVLSK
ncbi:MAG: T9SS type A sorting domain-containing protein [Bacteroidota bacterium]